MSKISQALAFLTRAAVTGLAIAFLVLYFWPDLAQRLHDGRAEPPDAVPEDEAPVSYADAVNRSAPSVVSIYTRSVYTRPVAPDVDPASETQRAGLRVMWHVRNDAGSGVIMSQDGYILTNHHVVDRVQSVEVALWDGRSVPARLVGSDPETDLAVLKVDLEDLPVAPVAAEQSVRVGDVVLAIGNALRLSHTVTMGIVSATGRNDLRGQLYQDFIQTDAAINRGNSGGAVVNARGELIGISTRNIDPALGQNIGFAIPIGLARNVMQQIVEYGSVRRGWLGAGFGDNRPTPLPDGSVRRQGIVVSEVWRDGPAWNAGIRQGDIVVSLDGEAVSDASEFQLEISERDPGSQVELEVVRGNESFQTYATLIQQPPLQ
jgi:serine peptidase DegS